MKSRKKFLPLLVFGVVALVATFFIVIHVNPSEPFSIESFQINPVYFLMISVFLTFSCLGSFILKSVKRGLLLGTLIIAILFLQYLHYNNALYTLILVVLVILIDIFFKKNK